MAGMEPLDVRSLAVYDEEDAVLTVGFGNRNPMTSGWQE